MSAEIQTVVKVDSGLVEKPACRTRRHRDIYRQSSVQHSMPYKKHKQQPEENKHKCCRKKPQHSFGGGNGQKPFPQHKKRKQFIPPTKFLLGGNINDPLNLNSLQDEEINRRMNAVTPQSSPLATSTNTSHHPNQQHHHRKGGGEVEVIIPANINDPLNLAGGEDEDDGGVAYAAFLTAATTPRRKRHKRKRHRSSTGSNKEEAPDIKSDESKTDDTFEGDVVDLGVPAPSNEGVEIEVEKGDNSKQQECAEAVRLEVAKPTHLDLVPQSQCSTASVKEFKKPKRSGGGEEKDPGGSGVCNASRVVGSGTSGGVNKKFDKDKIVSPVIPQPGAWTTGTHRFRKPAQKPSQHTPKFKEQNKRFQYGNYNRYYGYRNLNHEVDPRLKLLVNRRELFEGRDVLDVGCNTGHITVSIARDLGARTVVGLDLDRSLVDAARANLRRHRPHTTTKQFPLSMPVTYGPLDVPGIHSSTGFPNNISFVQGNYVLQSDVLVELEQPQFDVILCLSVTKWLHLNWGDAGLKRAFKRMFAQLRPGGTLILEPQSWTSYKRKKNLTEAIWKNYQMIKLFPPKFTQYLLTEVGFSKCEVIGAPLHQSRGFQRPIKVFTKGETPLSSRTPADRREVEEERKATEINDNAVGMETNDTKDSDSSEVLGRLSEKISNLGYLEGNNGNSSNSMDIENKVKTKLLTKSPTNITEGECATESSILKHSCVKRKMSESELSIDDSISAKRLLTECKVEALQNKPSCDPHTIQNISNGFVLTKENSLKQSSEGETLEGTEIINSNKTVENNGKPGERSENGSER